MKTLEVALSDRAYPIHVGHDLLSNAGQLLDVHAGQRGVIVSNAIVAAHHLASLKSSLQRTGMNIGVVLLPDGEAHKNQRTLDDLLTRLLELRVERSTTLIALGGGVVGDIAGFAAAIYQRGIPFVQIPTTLLAQVDSSVGGKTGINHPLGKNMIGAFWQPQAVLIDTSVLSTLPDRELSAGLAEVIKYGAIRDVDFFTWLEANMASLRSRDTDALTHAIVRSCAIKADVVAADERESGERALLNFGHTFGHAIEAAQGYGEWLHGEAVAAGMMCAARLSERVCGFPVERTARLARLIDEAKLPTVPPKIATGRWLELMRRDKKVQSGNLRFVVLERLGCAALRDDIREDDVTSAISAASTNRD
ncbi:MAG TPA: 3-dehydroquinate synthase [Casimicrobiaceae bacterium]